MEVCGFKDCKRAGGGSRLEKQITEILEERGVEMEVLNCDCQVSSIKDMTVGGIDYDEITHTHTHVRTEFSFYDYTRANVGMVPI